MFFSANITFFFLFLLINKIHFAANSLFLIIKISEKVYIVYQIATINVFSFLIIQY